MNTVMSNLKKDFIASHLRSQLTTLQKVLEDVQNSYNPESEYAIESLKRVELSIRKLRFFLNN
ncbi:MAG: hypothetical protein WCY34_05600 [Candidatus Omnitrophota bacterium]|jgi:hypothetical protein